MNDAKKFSLTFLQRPKKNKPLFTKGKKLAKKVYFAPFHLLDHRRSRLNGKSLARYSYTKTSSKDFYAILKAYI